MADFYPAFLQEFYAKIAAVWSDVVLPGSGGASNVWTSVQAFRHDFEQEAQASQLGLAGSISPPYVVVVIGVSNDDDTVGLGSVRFKRARVQIFRIETTQSGGTQDSVNGKLKALLDYIDGYDTSGAGNFVNFQVQEFGSIDSSEANPWNAAALGDNKTELIGGHVKWEPGFLVGP